MKTEYRRRKVALAALLLCGLSWANGMLFASSGTVKTRSCTAAVRGEGDGYAVVSSSLDPERGIFSKSFLRKFKIAGEPLINHREKFKVVFLDALDTCSFPPHPMSVEVVQKILQSLRSQNLSEFPTPAKRRWMTISAKPDTKVPLEPWEVQALSKKEGKKVIYLEVYNGTTFFPDFFQKLIVANHEIEKPFVKSLDRVTDLSDKSIREKLSEETADALSGEFPIILIRHRAYDRLFVLEKSEDVKDIITFDFSDAKRLWEKERYDKAVRDRLNSWVVNNKGKSAAIAVGAAIAVYSGYRMCDPLEIASGAAGAAANVTQRTIFQMNGKGNPQVPVSTPAPTPAPKLEIKQTPTPTPTPATKCAPGRNCYELKHRF